MITLVAVVVGLVVLGIVSIAVMMLWNAVVPDVFGLPELGYMQAVYLMVLIALIKGTGLGMRAPPAPVADDEDEKDDA